MPQPAARGSDAQLIPRDSFVRLPGTLVALADSSDPADSAVTTWIQVLRVGKFWSPRYKTFSVTKATLATMVENFTTVTPKAPTLLPLDYNHGTSRPETVEQGKAAGWINELELRAEGSELWAQVELTPQAAALVRNKEYRYVSATFDFEYVFGNDTGGKPLEIGPTLLAAALTNTPFVEGMQPATLAREQGLALTDDDDADPPLRTPRGARNMATIKMKDAKGNEIELSQESVDALVAAHTKAAGTESVELAKFNELKAKVDEQDTKVLELTAMNNKLIDRDKKRDADAKVELNVRNGRITPAQREEWAELALTNPAMFDKLIAKQPKQVEYEKRTGSEEDAGGLSATDEVLALSKVEQDKNSKLDFSAAMDVVFRKNPTLYDKYKAEAAVKV